MNTLLGEITQKPSLFPNLDAIFLEFTQDEFRKLPARKRFKKVNKTLLQLIQEAQGPCFLLSAVIEFIDRVNSEKLLNEHFTLDRFEFWLNLFSKLSLEDNLHIRGKIVGRYVPRSEFQSMFPVGMNRLFPGTHFVAAHLSPDVDTTVSSLWGWMDAFGCRVAEGRHQWGLPNITADAHLVRFLQDFFGRNFFDIVMRKSSALTMTAMDLVTKKDMTKIPSKTHLSSVDHTHANKALILLDDEGYFMGEWRNHDAESITQITSLFCSVLRWFESTFIANTARLLVKGSLLKSELQEAYNALLALPIKQAAPLSDSTDKQKKLLGEFLRKILHLKQGLLSSFQEILLACDSYFQSPFSLFQHAFTTLLNASIFDESDALNNSRTAVMGYFETVISGLEAAVLSIYHATDRLDILLAVRDQVLGQPSLFVTLKSDIEEMRNKIGSYDFLPVVIPEEGGKWFPVGIVRAPDLKKNILGTASLRDFSNLEETKLASYVDVISIIDHHKSNISTSSAATLIISDAQSSNTLVAELSIAINDRYRTRTSNGYFIHPGREFVEYMSCIFAILDDTDLLSKVSKRDLVCIKELLNRMKSLSTDSEFDLIDFSDIPDTHEFVQIAASRLLQNPDLHSIYQKVYRFKELEVEQDLLACVSKKPSHIFADTKEQNGCCRIGQTKLFSKNFASFLQYHEQILQLWKSQSEALSAHNPHVDFYMQMISTIPGEKEVYEGAISWAHQDELWIWAPQTTSAREHLIRFLNGFNSSEAVQNNPIEVQLFGNRPHELEMLFDLNFPKGKIISCTDGEEGILALFRYKAGLINSRKSQISPYLPKLVP